LTNRSFGACNADYYLQSIKKISSLVQDPSFLIFTNDKAWVKENFPSDISYTIYSNDRNLNTDIEEMLLMAKLKSLIISNSTFSWWSAFLNTIPQQNIICPSNWFLKKGLQESAYNFILKDWIVINNRLELKD
jgi:hypothetical protein